MGRSLTRMTQKSVGWGGRVWSWCVSGGRSTVKPGMVVHDSDAARHRPRTPRTTSCSLELVPHPSLFLGGGPLSQPQPGLYNHVQEPPPPLLPPPGPANLAPACLSAEGSPLGAGSWRTWEISHNDLNRPRLGLYFPWKPVRSRSKERRDHKKRI